MNSMAIFFGVFGRAVLKIFQIPEFTPGQFEINPSDSKSARSIPNAIGGGRKNDSLIMILHSVEFTST